MKLWDKGKTSNQFVEQFTTGLDKKLDMELARYDIIGSIAHAKMLSKVSLLSADELKKIHNVLVDCYKRVEQGQFVIDPDIEDIHSQLEFILTKELGQAGKKIHTGRSRNDQVHVDIRLFTRDKLLDLTDWVYILFKKLQKLSDLYKNNLLPGYTHLQLAMPSSFGLWFGAYAESLSDDLKAILAAYQINNQSPLGAAAGYGSSFPIDRGLTARLLGFDSLAYNVIYAQMGRGKVERLVAFSLANLASTIGKLANDVCLFLSQNFGFLSLPDEFTTGSSIMPHKKNPDIFEMIRGRCNRLQSIPIEIGMIGNFLTSGISAIYN
jgi:argininosuccinate lyase